MRSVHKEEKMDRKGNRELVPLARNLRKEMTKEERKLWYQFPLGNYIFVTLILVLCCVANIIIRDPIIYAINIALLIALVFVQRKYVSIALRIVKNTLKRS